MTKNICFFSKLSIKKALNKLKAVSTSAMELLTLELRSKEPYVILVKIKLGFNGEVVTEVPSVHHRTQGASCL